MEKIDIKIIGGTGVIMILVSTVCYTGLRVFLSLDKLLGIFLFSMGIFIGMLFLGVILDECL